MALTLREVCGLTTEEIARAFLATPSTIAQRIVREIENPRCWDSLRSPVCEELPERLETILQVVYLVFNEGYSASAGQTLLRTDLSEEAIRLARLLLEMLPEPEVMGLLALMLLHESRRGARTSPDGDIILLDDQDRALWDREQINEGGALVARAMSTGPVGAYTIQAAISATHASADRPDATDWQQIVLLYDSLLQITPSPIVELNRAVAIAMRDGPAAGLTIIDGILARGDLTEYHLAHAARADLCRRLGQTAPARQAYQEALNLARQEPERRFLERRLAELP